MKRLFTWIAYLLIALAVVGTVAIALLRNHDDPEPYIADLMPDPVPEWRGWDRGNPLWALWLCYGEGVEGDRPADLDAAMALIATGAAEEPPVFGSLNIDLSAPGFEAVRWAGTFSEEAWQPLPRPRAAHDRASRQIAEIGTKVWIGELTDAVHEGFDRAEQLAKEGAFGESLAIYESVIRFCQGYARSSIWLPANMVILECSGMLGDSIYHSLPDWDPSGEHCSRLVAMIADFSEWSATTTKRGLKEEFATMRSWVLAMTDPQNSEEDGILPNRTIGGFAEWFRPYIKACDPYNNGFWEEIQDEQYDKLHEKNDSLWDSFLMFAGEGLRGNAKGKYVLVTGCPTLNGIPSSAHWNANKFQAIRIMLAMKAFERANNRPPCDIAEMVPEFLPDVPLDRASGIPLRMSKRTLKILSADEISYPEEISFRD